MAANDRQVAGNHYRDGVGKCPHCGGEIQHWDLYAQFPYLVGQVTKYVMRDKNGLEDLQKAAHFLEKLAETNYGANLFPQHEGTAESPKVPKHAASATKKR